jgi:hypothetical protein
MFKSEHTKSALKIIGDFFWPSIGWRRSFRYIRHRIVRIKDSSYSVAMGLSLGAAISFTPLPGTHFIQAGVFAALLRTNVIAGLIGTLVGNPWTFPLMWWLAYLVGEFTFRSLGFHVAEMPAHFSWDRLIFEIENEPMALLLPWVLGGYILMLLSLPFFYLLFYFIIERTKATQHLWKEDRLHKLGRQITGQVR